MEITKELKYKKKINTLENKVKDLENIIKGSLFDNFMENIDIIEENTRLKKENKRLRTNNHTLNDLLKEKD